MVITKLTAGAQGGH